MTNEIEKPHDAQKIILFVADRADPKMGELMVIDDAKKAESTIEGLLEAGYDQEHVKVFSGTPSEVVVTHRPVVTLAQAETRMSDAFRSVAGDAMEPDRRSGRDRREATDPTKAPAPDRRTGNDRRGLDRGKGPDSS